MKQNDFQKVANQVSFVTIVVNILLAFMKLLAGVFAHSNAMISDSIHSASDVFSTMIVVIGIKLSSKQPDKEHPYGHERMECVAAIVLSMVLFMTGLGIGVEALTDVLKGEYSHLQVPGMLALAAAVISIVSKEAMYWCTRYYAKKIDSSALMADACITVLMRFPRSVRWSESWAREWDFRSWIRSRAWLFSSLS